MCNRTSRLRLPPPPCQVDLSPEKLLQRRRLRPARSRPPKSASVVHASPSPVVNTAWHRRRRRRRRRQEYLKHRIKKKEKTSSSSNSSYGLGREELARSRRWLGLRERQPTPPAANLHDVVGGLKTFNFGREYATKASHVDVNITGRTRAKIFDPTAP